MADKDFSRESFPWLRGGFDLEGYVGALAALLVGILLGYVLGLLFWIGFIAAVVILFATRTAERTPPEAEGLIVAPTDGIVVSVNGATAPDELRLDGTDWTRVRVSIGPTKTNGIHAPMDGAIDHIIRETGDPAAFAAMKPDRPGLAVAYVSLQSGDRAVGMRFATGGLGPRLEVDAEAGDAVRLGRNIGTLRLGGWCDLYLPASVKVLPMPGQTLIGSETILARFGDTESRVPAPAAVETAPDLEPEPDAEPDNEAPPADADPIIDEEDELTLEALDGGDETDASASEDEDEDVSEMFARLRKEAQKMQDDD
ncbi:MAG: phosphatidylserine decarboxylase [Pseudomonadota bacterium]